jgi:hypothetical protein
MNRNFVIGLDQRDAVMAAVAAIRRQLKDMGPPASAPALMVISTNLTIIQTALTDLRWATAESSS